ncbi:MAG: hypothetical protein E6R08_04095 [Nevskiaceae bacterium]|nr:MAG: hypothetical protein E6R08_04095 [Nevskiaceae bacterium]
MSRKPVDTRQLTLDAMFMAPAPEPRHEEGSLDISHQVREALFDSLETAKRAGKDRFTVAADMSRLLGRAFGKNSLDRNTAQSADAWRFPLEALPALIQVTGDYRLLDLIAEACGCRMLRGENAWIAEVGALMAAQQEIKTRLAKYKEVLPSGMADELMSRAQKRTGGF